MATGRRAFSGGTTGTIHEAILNRTPIPVGRVTPESPQRLEEVINKALEKDRSLRYQNASELRADLQRLKRDRDGSAVSPPEGAAPHAGSTHWWRRWPAIVAGVVALAAVVVAGGQLVGVLSKAQAIDSIAVLPFVNSSGDPDSEYLSDGITESLIDRLSQIPSLRVTARSTVFRYKGKEMDPQKIGQDLRVRAVLSGRLLQREGTLVVRAELDPNYAVAYEVLGGLYASKGMYPEALSSIEKAAGLNRGAALSLANLGYVRARLGQREEARRILRQLAASSKERYTPAVAFAIVHVGLGENDQALSWLGKAYEERFNRLAYLRREAVWDPLRQDPRFEDLLRRIGLPQ